MEQARNYTFDELDTVMDQLLECDVAMKTGADAETEIDVLVAELTRNRARVRRLFRGSSLRIALDVSCPVSR